jgi:hypothetical protein
MADKGSVDGGSGSVELETPGMAVFDSPIGFESGGATFGFGVLSGCGDWFDLPELEFMFELVIGENITLTGSEAALVV